MISAQNKFWPVEKQKTIEALFELQWFFTDFKFLNYRIHRRRPKCFKSIQHSSSQTL